MVSFLNSLKKKIIRPYLSSGVTGQKIQKSVNLLPPEDALRYLLELDNYLYSLLGQASVRYGDGVHSKHRHINYHDFFIRHINPGETVLDLGCGNGACAFEIATSIPGCYVVGIDSNTKAIEFAISHYPNERLIFQVGDIMGLLPVVEKPVIVLSNVLEHLSGRTAFLSQLQTRLKPDRFLIRVPVYERDWRVPLKEELGIDYRLDPTHETEYRKGELEKELLDAGLKIETVEYGWGEMWCVVKNFHC